MTATEVSFDLHTHHERCGHASGCIEEYVTSAISKGLDYIGISDHSPYFYSENDHLYPGIAMPISQFDHYIKEVLGLKEKYASDIHVLLGMESDFFELHQPPYQNIIDRYPFDYVIGSVHYVNDVNIFTRGRWDQFSEEEAILEKKEYYRLIQQSAKSGMFQILGHIDAMKGFYPAFSDIPAQKEIDDTLRIIGEEEVAIEVNTSGKMKDVGGWYPSHEILERALFHGVDITFGSDAHVPERVGDDFENVKKVLKDIGFTRMVYFVEREKREVRL
ncbi:histidinol-phosphatase [Aureibacillus halotolerans]|uniref:Histidinol-phosphatase n=1 Tax=Aureibacillus halotolerans TaxID=1508390 RepID=A0A4R6UCP2_9BACI|nr:histidinol-phosphatase [Aureibacillus halotolerans]TDQ40854.1 histidinol-phosphatase (PHP family) [Aureibacillus halotolerans]